MYSTDMKWIDWSQLNSNGVNELRTILNKRYADYKKFYAFTYGLSDAQILALPFMVGKGQTDLDNLRNSFNIFKYFYESYYGLNGSPLSIYDYSGYQIPFEGQ